MKIPGGQDDGKERTALDTKPVWSLVVERFSGATILLLLCIMALSLNPFGGTSSFDFCTVLSKKKMSATPCGYFSII